jgi:hypothetical protein
MPEHPYRGARPAIRQPERFPAKWTSGSPSKTRQRINPERVSDSEGTEAALVNV